MAAIATKIDCLTYTVHSQTLKTLSARQFRDKIILVVFPATIALALVTKEW